ncbi:MAG TPA: RdgB/HAM1 family non-canonical purine NTP pyrophosphatase [Rhizomicrobium sp.]|jgi:XTP/dITP diphosphohydrolase
MIKAKTLVIASHNPGKVREIEQLLLPFDLSIVSASDLGLCEVDESGATFAENAEIKARAAAESAGMSALADDSGLAVTALDGAPGIYSARWAGPDKDFGSAMARIEHELQLFGTLDYSARFVCALALAQPGAEIQIFEGEVAGELTFPPRGSNGFGYDPIFVANGMRETFGELDPSRKHAISHRARAFAKLKQYLERGDAAL